MGLCHIYRQKNGIKFDKELDKLKKKKACVGEIFQI